jgi:hypothetical protein
MKTTESAAFRGPLRGRSPNQGSQAFGVKEYPEIGDRCPASRQETATPDLLVLAGGHSEFETHRMRE